METGKLLWEVQLLFRPTHQASLGDELIIISHGALAPRRNVPLNPVLRPFLWLSAQGQERQASLLTKAGFLIPIIARHNSLPDTQTLIFLANCVVR